MAFAFTQMKLPYWIRPQQLHNRDRVNKPYIFYSFSCFQQQEFEFIKKPHLLGQKGPRYVAAF